MSHAAVIQVLCEIACLQLAGIIALHLYRAILERRLLKLREELVDLNMELLRRTGLAADADRREVAKRLFPDITR